MSRHQQEEELPACYAIVQPGIEPIAADEITRDVGGTIKKTDRGVVVFRVPSIDKSLLELRTVEDVYLLAWGTDSLTYRALDLKQIRQWTAKEPNWKQLLRHHHTVHSKPKGKPSYRLVTQMNGKHVYHRKDAMKALAQGLAGVFPDSWNYADENASVEVWLTIDGQTAICGVRLSDRTMRHRTYKTEHLPASLRPTVAAAMVRLAGSAPGHVVVDPMCGAGTILAEQIELSKQRRAGRIDTWGGDIEMNALRAAEANLRKVGPTPLARWEATRLPLPNDSVDRIISNPPFGKQLLDIEEIGPLYHHMIREADRILRPGGRAVYLVMETAALRDAIRKVGWQPMRQLQVEVLGQNAQISVWQKPLRHSTVDTFQDAG